MTETPLEAGFRVCERRDWTVGGLPVEIVLCRPQGREEADVRRVPP
ncbi:hypothetical protein [Natronococcus occultus]|nr:hypothetical protein [Natronococcus occultus]